METVPTSFASASFPVTDHFPTSTPRNGRGSLIGPDRDRSWRTTPQWPSGLWPRPVGSAAFAWLLGTVRTL